MNLSERVAFLQQGFDLGVREFHDLLLPLVQETAEACQHDVPWLEQEGHVRHRKSASVR